MKYRERIIKHLKLIEAVGLLLAFTAWTLDWSAVQTWNSDISNLRASIDSIQFAYATNDNSRVVQLEAAVTRATQSNSGVTTDALSNYTAAWKSAEVRSKWLSRALNDLMLVENLSRTLKTADKELIHKYTRLKVRDIETKLSEIKSRLAASLPPDLTNVPSPDLLRGRDAGAIDSDVRELHAELGGVINEALTVLNRTKGSREQVYRFIFALGALLIVVAKLIEWWVDLTEKPSSTI